MFLHRKVTCFCCLKSVPFQMKLSRKLWFTMFKELKYKFEKGNKYI
jgi:hypothetical protein